MSDAGANLAMFAGVSLVDEVRAAAMSVFGRFACELGEPGVDGALLWLSFNVLASPATRDELEYVAAFVQSPQELIDRAVHGGWIELVDDRYVPAVKLRGLSSRVTAISQRNNLAWREAITQGESAAPLEGTLQLLRGGN